MRERWTTARIADVANVVNGGTPKTKVPEFWGGPHLWITPAEMGNRVTPYLAESRRTLTDSGLQRSSASLVPPNSVILSTRAPIGHLVINTEPMAFNQGCRGLVPGENLNDKYLYYFLSANTTLLNGLGSGTTFKELAAGKLKKVQLPVPPLEEQKRIVAILDEAFAGIETAIANTEKNLANARELFESYLSYAFQFTKLGDRRERLCDLCEGRAITYGVIKLGHEIAGGVPCLRTSNVRRLRIDTDGIKRIDPDLSSQYSRTILNGGEVLVNVRGTLGGVAVASREMRGWNISREVAIVPVDKERVSPAFAAYSLATKECQDWLTGVQKGVAYTGINLADLRELEIKVPNLDHQNRIANQLDEMTAKSSALASQFQDKLRALAELKQSLLQKAFSGELTADRVEEELESATA